MVHFQYFSSFFFATQTNNSTTYSYWVKKERIKIILAHILIFAKTATGYWTSLGFHRQQWQFMTLHYRNTYIPNMCQHRYLSCYMENEEDAQLEMNKILFFSKAPVSQSLLWLITWHDMKQTDAHTCTPAQTSLHTSTHGVQIYFFAPSLSLLRQGFL